MSEESRRQRCVSQTEGYNGKEEITSHTNLQRTSSPKNEKSVITYSLYCRWKVRGSFMREFYGLDN